LRWVRLPASNVRRLLLVSAETGLLVTTFLVATWVRLGMEGLEAPRVMTKALLAAFLIQLFLYYGDLYEQFASPDRLEFAIGLARAFLGGTLALAIVFFTIPALRVGRGVLLIFLPVAFVAFFAWRTAGLDLWKQEALRDRVLILGTGRSAQALARDTMRLAPLDFQIVGFLAERAAEVGKSIVNPSVIGTLADLPRVVREEQVSRVVVALEDFRGRLPVADLLRCRLAGVKVEEITTFLERLTGKIPVRDLRPSWLVFSEGFNRPRLFPNTKRSVEFVLALVGLILASPVLGLLILLVKLDSRGPVLYGQERVGERGRPFLLYKLRTMRVDAEAGTGPVWSQRDADPRVTRVGRLLRKLRLDEIPQLFNILRGEMSFVGPRPERPHFVEQLRSVIPYYDERHTVKPGITGWAQIKFGYGSNLEDAEEKLQFDLFYVKNMSPLLDLSIVFHTVKVMLLGRGAR
jgi:sugar transferase (PEP-CTERM system associated)